ncbi:hypothetical protein CACET_c16810 [Clostridium aceticum]|uniref:Phage shock protein B n=1 Tax=Clostridium aceticum TaxID=84022 RepID=A0A0G3WB73_9CLOT|nr:hypothetical protein [Clostridium aceticum]AKL95130.1 hypothetical protein CACET_c16810 [Clostridium aceticum]
MELTLLLLMGIGYIIYKVAFQVPKQIERNEEKIDMLKLQLKEMHIKLDKIIETLDKKN